MAKYSLWICDDQVNKYCIPFSRDGKTTHDKVELYEIDMLTIGLGKDKFIQNLKKSGVMDSHFNWDSVTGYITYQVNGKTKHLPLLFQQDPLLLKMINFENKCRYHQRLSESKTIAKMNTKIEEIYYSSIINDLSRYCDQMLDRISNNKDNFDHPNLTKQLGEKIYCYMNATEYDEKRGLKNDLLKMMLSYINFRRMKSVEYNCTVNHFLIQKQYDKEEVLERIDPDERAFLSEEELAQMEGYLDGKSK